MSCPAALHRARKPLIVTPLMRPDITNAESQRLLVVSGIIDLALGVLKVLIGFIASSHALVADGIHSLSDLATDILVWFFNRIGVQAPDEDHPYGHARFETFGTFILGVLLIAVAAGLVYDNVVRLMDITDVRVPAWEALAAAAASVAIKEWLYQITRRLGERIRSRLLVANAWHHRSDAMSSIIVFIGIGGAMLGVVWLELIAAIGVALMIGQIGWKLSRQSVEELVDTAQSGAYVGDIEQTINDVEGVRGVHSIRTRRMGPDVLVDVHLQVQPVVSVSEGHHIGEWVSRRLLRDYEEINDVIVHIDAEDDEYIEDRQKPYPIAPLRRQVREELEQAWQDRLDITNVRRMTLHYLNNGVSVELFLDRSRLDPDDINSEQLTTELMQLGKDLPWLRQVDIWYA